MTVSVVKPWPRYAGLAPLRLLLLTSADGVRWSQVPEPDAAFGAAPPTNRCDVTALVSDGGRVFAAGVQTYVDLNAPLHRVAEPELWSSAEGTSWSPLQGSGTPTDGCGWEGTIMTVARAGGWLLAAGNVGLGGFSPDSEAAVWASSDGGAHWSALTQSVDLLDPGQAKPVIRSMAALGDSVVAVGSSDLGHGLAWRAIPTPTPTPPPVIGRDLIRASA